MNLKSLNIKVIGKWLLKHSHEVFFIFSLLLMDCVSTVVITGYFFPNNHIAFTLTILAVLFIALSTRNKIAEISIFIVFSLFILICEIALQIAYVNQGGVAFNYETLIFAGEGLKVLDLRTLFVSPVMFITGLTIVGIDICFLAVKKLRVLLWVPEKRPKKQLIMGIGTLVYLMILIPASLFLSGYEKYDYNVFLGEYKDVNRYYGVTGNFFVEFYGQSNTPIKLTDEYLKTNLHSVNPTFNSTSLNKNLLIITVETFEWFGFIQDMKKYPEGLKGLDNDELHQLFPNLYSLIDNPESNYIGKENYSKDKSNNSEALALLGNIPLKYSLPMASDCDFFFSIPNQFKNRYPDSTLTYFHNNNLDFYGRDKYLKKFGFENIYGKDELIANLGADKYDYLTYDTVGEKASMITDSSLVRNNLDLMIPKDKQFMTFWMTLTTHGPFEYERIVFKENYNKLLSLSENSISNEVANFSASMMDFDLSLGLILDDLRNKNIADKTTIILVGDHDAFMSDLSTQVKEIPNDDSLKFNIPLIISDVDLNPNKLYPSSSILSIAPTVMELFGISYYKELYLNNSLFIDTNSQLNYLYSYAFSMFVSPEGLAYNLNKYGSVYIDETLFKEHLSYSIEQFIFRQRIIDDYYVNGKTKKKFLKLD